MIAINAEAATLQPRVPGHYMQLTINISSSKFPTTSVEHIHLYRLG